MGRGNRHVASIQFAEGTSAIDSLINLLDSAGSERMVSSDAQIITRLHYEQSFGIVNHTSLDNTPEEVFALVTLNDNENIWKDDLMHERARRFARLKMSTLTGMSWKEFVELPYSVCDMWFSIAEEERMKEASIGKDVERQMVNASTQK